MNTFKKHERLKSKKLIEQLFENSKSVDAPPLKLLWMPVETEGMPPVQGGFTASKRNFPRAVDRNRIKRLMREAWRLQKAELYDFLLEKKMRLAVMIIYTSKKIPEFKEVMEKTAIVMQRLKERL